MDGRLVGDICAWERLFRRDRDEGPRGDATLGYEVGSGVFAEIGEVLVCGVRRRSKDLVSRAREDMVGGRSREAREGVGVLLGELVVLRVSDGVMGTLSSNSVPLREP